MSSLSVPFGHGNPLNDLLRDDAQFDVRIPMADGASDREAIVQAISTAVMDAVLNHSIPERGQLVISWAIQPRRGGAKKRAVAVAHVARFVQRTVAVETDE